MASIKHHLRGPVRGMRDWASVRLPTFPLRHVPLRRWPSLVGRVYGIRAPNSVRAKSEPSPGGSAHTQILLDLMDRTSAVTGDIAQCGVFRGETLLAMGLHARNQQRSGQVFGFDSFEGFDETVDFDVELGGEDNHTRRRGGFSDTSQALLQRKIDHWSLNDRVQLVRGYFDKTLPDHTGRTFSFVHLDCDIYQSYKTCLEFFYPRLSMGAVVLFDEYNDPPWPGCNLAVDAFLADKPETLECLERGNYQKWAFTKR